MPVFIASGSLDRKVNVWDAGGHVTRSLAFPESQVNCMSYSPHRSLLAAGGHGCIRLYTGSSAQQTPAPKGKGAAQDKAAKSDGPQKGVLGVTDASTLSSAGNVVHMAFVPLASKKGSGASEEASTDLGPSWASTLQSWDNAAALLTSQAEDASNPAATQHVAEGVNITKVGGSAVGTGDVLATTFFTNCAPQDDKSGKTTGRVPVVVSEDIVTFGSATDPQASTDDSSSTKHTVWLDVALVAAFEDGSVRVFALKGTTSASFSVPQEDTNEQAAPLLYYVRKNANHKKGEDSKAALPLAVLYHRLESVSFHLVRDIPTHVPITSAQCLPSRQVMFTGSQLGRILVWSMPALLGFFDGRANSTTTTPTPPPSQQQLSFSVDVSTAFGSYGEASEGVSSKQPILQELALEGDASTIRAIAIAPLMNYIVAATDGGKVHAFTFIQGRRSHVLGSLWSHVHTKAAQGGADGLSAEVWERQRVQAGSTTEATWAPLSIGWGSDTMMLRRVQRPVRNSNPKYPQSCNPYALEQFSFFAAHQQYVLNVAVSPNGRYIVTSSADSSVCIWKVPEPLALGQFLWFRDLAGSPSAPQNEKEAPRRGSDAGDADSGSNGGGSSAVPITQVTAMQQCASAVTDLIAKSKSSSKDVKPLEAVLSTVAAVASGVRGHYIFGGGVGAGITEDCSLLGSWGLARVLVGHSRWVWSCAVSPCSTYILSVSSDHSGRLWQLPPGLGSPATYASCSAAAAFSRIYSRDGVEAAVRGVLAEGDVSTMQKNVVALLKGTLFLPVSGATSNPVDDLSFEYCWGEAAGKERTVPDIPLPVLQYVEHAAAEAVLEHQSAYYLASKGADDATLVLPPQPAPTTQTATVASFIGHSRPVTCCLLDIYQ